MAPRRKTRRGRSRRKQKTQRGRGRIATGQTSELFRPPLRCVGNTNTPYRSNMYVGKLTKKQLPRHQTIVAWIASIDPTGAYTLPPLLSCKLAPEQTNKNYKKAYAYQQIQKFGGVSLQQRLEAQEDPLADILLPLQPFLTHLAQFNTQFVHNDLHSGNIVWDGASYKMIDFDTMDTRETVQGLIEDELLSKYEKNGKNGESEEFQKDLDAQTDLYMKHHDINMLAEGLLSDLDSWEDDAAKEFIQKMEEATSAGLIPPYDEKVDCTEAFATLFAALKAV